jgi:catechol 2,3-dioxygenase-like lactoylglutathione lyase family enzyme
MPHRSLWHSIPILPFSSTKATCAFYQRLGFETVHREANYLMFRKDEVEVHCARKGHFFVNEPASCYLRTPDVDRLYAGLNLDPHSVLSPPADRSWHMREFHLRDPFGNVLRFGQPTTD